MQPACMEATIRPREYKKIKNNAKLPSNTKSITLYLQNTKTKATFAVQIMEKGFFYELE